MKIYPQHFPELDSTNRLLKELASCGAPEGTLVAADRQHAGRGRLGRSFFSPEGGLYFSLLLRPSALCFDTTLLTTAAAVAVAEAVDELMGDTASRIKWVNDIYRNGRKICGILAEGVVRGSETAVVLGIGLNILTPAEGYPEDIALRAGALYKTLPEGQSLPSLREMLTDRILARLIPLYEALPDRTYLNVYREKMMLTGQTVRYEKDGVLHEGTVRSVADDGSLLLTENHETVRLAAGEVSLKQS